MCRGLCIDWWGALSASLKTAATVFRGLEFIVVSYSVWLNIKTLNLRLYDVPFFLSVVVVVVEFEVKERRWHYRH